MPQFSLQRLFASVTLIGVGCWLYTGFMPKLALRLSHPSWMHVVLWFAGGMLVGAGIFNVFGRIKLGMLIGFFVQLLFMGMVFV